MGGLDPSIVPSLVPQIIAVVQAAGVLGTILFAVLWWLDRKRSDARILKLETDLESANEARIKQAMTLGPIIERNSTALKSTGEIFYEVLHPKPKGRRG